MLVSALAWLSLFTVEKKINVTSRVHFGSYSVLDNVGEVSSAQPVPDHIPRPPYAETGQPPPPPGHPEIHTGANLDAMRAACRLAAKVQNAVKENIKVRVLVK